MALPVNSTDRAKPGRIIRGQARRGLKEAELAAAWR